MSTIKSREKNTKDEWHLGDLIRKETDNMLEQLKAEIKAHEND